MLLKVTASLAAVCTIVLAASAAQAQSWDEKIELCAEAADAEGVIDLNEYDVRFDGATSRRVSVAFAPVRKGDIVEVECKIARGRVISVEVAS